VRGDTYARIFPDIVFHKDLHSFETRHGVPSPKKTDKSPAKKKLSKEKHSGRHRKKRTKCKDKMRGDFYASILTKCVWQRSRCPATNFLLCITAVVYVLQMLTQGWLLDAGAKDNSMIVQGQYYRLLTAMLLHIGLVHLLCNCFSLNTVGPIVEMLFGTERMVITYVLAGLGGNLLSFSLTQARSVGASNAVFGLVGAFGVYVLRHRKLYGKRSDRILNSIIKTCLLNVCIGLIPCMRIDNWGHLGGAVVGATVGYLFGPNLIKTRWGLVDQPLIALPSLR